MISDPAILVAPVITPRPAAGYRRRVQFVHPATGIMNLLVTDASWGEQVGPNYTNYALTPAFGPKQKRIHTTGTSEISWNISGQLSSATLGLVQLMLPAVRGIHPIRFLLQQGNFDVYEFQNQNGFSLPWGSFTLNGAENSAVTFSLEGKSTVYPVSVFPVVSSDIITPVPSWYTGNDLVLAWSLSHTVNLTAVWANTASELPAYYRTGQSEYVLQITTAVGLRQHSKIRFGFGGITLEAAVVTERNRLLGGTNEPVTYRVSMTGVAVTDDQAYQPVVTVNVNPFPGTDFF